MAKRVPRAGLIDVVGNNYVPTELGLAHIGQMAAIGAKVREIAQYLRVSEKYLRDALDPDSEYFVPAIDAAFNDGQSEFRKRLLQAQAALAESNAQMAIHLGKQHLDQRENPVEHNHTIRVVGTLPDYGGNADDWKRQFAPSALQAVPAPDVIDAEVIEED
jgi:hypothetical protein